MSKAYVLLLLHFKSSFFPYFLRWGLNREIPNWSEEDELNVLSLWSLASVGGFGILPIQLWYPILSFKHLKQEQLWKYPTSCESKIKWGNGYESTLPTLNYLKRLDHINNHCSDFFSEGNSQDLEWVEKSVRLPSPDSFSLAPPLKFLHLLPFYHTQISHSFFCTLISLHPPAPGETSQLAIDFIRL